MEPANPLSDLPFFQNLRSGQRQVLDSLDGRKQLIVQLPTGYGKTRTYDASYSLLKKRGRVNRLLVIFPTDKQLDQYVQDAPADLRAVGVDEPRKVLDVRFFGTMALQQHRKNTCQVFAITIQALIQKKGRDVVNDLFQSGRWMVVVDEYHHYGVERAWGKEVNSLACEFLMALSATPYRAGEDDAFGKPDVCVTYKDAVGERAVKPLVGHSYVYRIDAVDEEGNVTSYTTSELASAAGGDSPEAVERFRVERKMRWSPKYVSPLVRVPIERMERLRLDTPGHCLQVLVAAMSVSHAKLVCEQIQGMFPEVTVDWVGTGEDGKSDAKNKETLARFCPKKDHAGKRHPTLSVLVHVGMAGEGLDCVHVSEVVFLKPANVNNWSKQFVGRGSRYMEGVTAHVNFDSCGEIATGGFVGKAFESLMDNGDVSGTPPDDDDGKVAGGDPPDIPFEPRIDIYDLELDHIDVGDEGYQLYTRLVPETLKATSTPADIAAFVQQLQDPDNPIHVGMIKAYCNMRRVEAAQYDEEAMIVQWKEVVKGATSGVVHRALGLIYGKDTRVERSTVGDLKHRINSHKKAVLGPVTPDVEVYRRHYQWIALLDRELREKGVPEWLA